jgi:hypothetical protein
VGVDLNCWLERGFRGWGVASGEGRVFLEKQRDFGRGQGIWGGAWGGQKVERRVGSGRFKFCFSECKI